MRIEGADDVSSLIIASANHTLHNGTYTCTVIFENSTYVEFEYIVLVNCE